MAVIATVAAAASAQGASGGFGGGTGDCEDARFGKRVLSLGDCGGDVKTLNWILNSKKYARKSPLGRAFKGRTERSVVKFQRREGIRGSGVVSRRTSRRLVRSMRRHTATWYGPGFYGHRTACGTRLTRRTVGVAHRRLPCGTRVTLKYRGRFLRTRVIDRGPYAHGASWDLTARAAKKLRLVITDRVRAAAVR
jgi:rare lipoprotein A (peptidoglycan hydrolase)